MVTGSDASGHQGLPRGGKQGGEVVPRGHLRQSREDIADVVEGIDAAALAGDDNRVNDRGAVAGVGMADEQEVFLVMLS